MPLSRVVLGKSRGGHAVGAVSLLYLFGQALFHGQGEDELRQHENGAGHDGVLQLDRQQAVGYVDEH